VRRVENKVRIVRATQIRHADEMLAIAPCIVQGDFTLSQVVQMLSSGSTARIISVVDHEQRLIGVFSAQTLFEDVFFQVVPEEFLTRLADYERSLEFVRLVAVRTASDIMRRPVYVKMSDTVQDAFHLMHEHKLVGLPICDEERRVIGYIDMIELLLVWLRAAEERVK
jgi:CBS-domain-containing membrane protein